MVIATSWTPGGANKSFVSKRKIWNLTEDPEPVVEGDHDDPAEGGEDPGVVEGGRAPGPGLAVHEHQHSQLWNRRIINVQYSRCWIGRYLVLNITFDFLQRKFENMQAGCCRKIFRLNTKRWLWYIENGMSTEFAGIC